MDARIQAYIRETASRGRRIERVVTIAFLTPEHDYTERLYARLGYQSIGTVLHISFPDS